MKLNILVFDDDPDIRNQLKTALEAKGHVVTTLSNPTEFEIFNRKNCPCSPNEPCADILIADIVMPKVEGVEFCKQLRVAGCWLLSRGNVETVSGYLTMHYMNDVNDMGIHYYRKPFELNDIYKWIEQCEERIAESLNKTSVD